MALINCPECGMPISNTAKKCVHCGYKLKYKKEFTEIKIAYIISIIGIIGIAELILIFCGFFE